MKKGITIIVVAFAVIATIMGAFSVRNSIKANKEFIADGYILDPSKEEFVTNGVDKQYYFSQGDKYKEKFGTQILFKQDSEDANITKEHFIHYTDGSLGSFTKGVLLDVSDLDQSNYAYYSLTKNTILVKNGNSYELSTKGEALALSEYVWKISDTDYMLISPTVTLKIGDQMIDFPDYAQISYVDNGIVRISHVTGTYQTISAESKLITASGAELSLVGKSFTAGDGSIISLDDLALNDDSYIKLDENVEDAPHIPTFNVINGKDGANGTNGTNGTDGEDGEDGDEGEEGSEGDIGQDGTEGQMGEEGSEGVLGEDGVEGESGQMGYDGADGVAGEDASNAGNASSLDSAQLNIKPIVSMVTDSTAAALGKEYYVDSGSASMTLQLEDPNDGGALKPNHTMVYLYDKETMALVNNDTLAAELGKQLEQNTNGASMKFSGLDPNKEYVVVVKGDYDIVDGYTLEGATLYTKVFKTDELGIEIAPLEVTDSKISFDTKVTDDRISQYAVDVYDYVDGVKRVLASYTINASDKGCDGVTVVLNGKNESHEAVADEDGKTKGSIITGGKTTQYNSYEIESDHKYYAEIANVTVTGTGMVNTGDAEIEMHTLKKQPYDKKVFNDDKVKQYVPQIQAILESNEKNRTLSVSLPELSDPDYGITGYRYELYEYNDDTKSKIDANDFSGLTAKFVKETEGQITQDFAIPDTDLGKDGSTYIGRVVVLFNDGQKDMELCSLKSNPNQLSATGGELVVEIIVTNTEITADSTTSAKHDMIVGYIRVSDPGKVLKFDNNNPIKLSATNDYKDINDFIFYPKDVLSTDDYQSAEYRIPFTYSGLREQTVHTLSAYGAVDTNGDKEYSDVERNTYLAGKRAISTNVMPLSLVGRSMDSPTAAFSMLMSFASPTSDGVYNSENVDPVSRSYTEYEAQIMDSITFSLWHVTIGEDGEPVEKKMRTTSLKNLSKAEDKEKNSTFQDAYVDRKDASSHIIKTEYVPDGQTQSVVIGGLELTEGTNPNNTYILDPDAFGYPDNLAEFYSGGYFKIKVDSAIDYTGFNDIPFVEGENFYAFAIQKKHVQAADPNKQVTVTLIDNEQAKDTAGYQDGVDDNTIVGFKFRAEYPYTDIINITYHIYEVTDTASTADLNKTLLYGTDTGKITEVLTATKTVGQSSGFKNDNVTFYFNGEGNDLTWVSKVEGTEVKDAIKRGKRYIVTYEVTSIEGHSDMDCSARSDKYPNCSYGTGEDVPLYRSQIVELDKQVPQIERYQVTSENANATWAYRFVDPDGAIITDGNGNITITRRRYSSYDNYTKGTINQSKDITVKNASTWNKVIFDELVDNYYYTTSISYKLSDSSSAIPIVSAPILHKATTGEPGAYSASSTSGVRAQGLVATNSIPAENQVNIGGKQYEKAVVNEGGFRYKITLRGADLYRYSAVHVEVQATKDIQNNTLTNGKKVVYDPVPLTGMNTVVEDGKTEVYTYVYLDTAPLQELLNSDVAEAKVTIKGYYNKNVYGFGTADSLNAYTGAKTTAEYTDKTLSGEKLYAIKTMNAVSYDKNQYRTLKYFDGKQTLDYSFETSTIFSNSNSLFIPGVDSNLNGLIISADDAGKNVASATMQQRYPYAPFAVSPMDSSSQYVLNNLKFDATGLYDSANGAYINVVELERSDRAFGLRDGDVSDIIKLADLMPAIQLDDSISVGATSAKLKMEVVGDTTQITDDNKIKIYAKILDEAGNYLQIEKKSMELNNVTSYYYEVKKNASGEPITTSESEYTKTSYGGNFIEVTNSAGKNITELSVKGLKLDSKYSVVFFAYNKENSPIELYSIDGKMVGYHYSFRTLKNVTIELEDPVFTAVSYGDKSVTMRYGVPGDEGTGIDIWYQLNGGTYVKATPLGDQVTYYSQDLKANIPIRYDADPGNWTYDVTRTIRVVAVEKGQNPNDSGVTILGENAKSINVDNEAPVFITTDYQDNSNPEHRLVGVDINVAYDPKREIVGDKFDVVLRDLEGNEIARETKTFASNTFTGKVTFDVKERTGKFNVEIVAKVNAANDNGAGLMDAVLSTTPVETSDKPKAEVISGSATKGTSTITLSLSGCQNFNKVDNMSITIYSDSNGFLKVYSGVVSVNDANVYTLPATVSLTEGTYSINIQYREGANSLGNQTGEFKVN